MFVTGAACLPGTVCTLVVFVGFSLKLVTLRAGDLTQ